MGCCNKRRGISMILKRTKYSMLVLVVFVIGVTYLYSQYNCKIELLRENDELYSFESSIIKLNELENVGVEGIILPENIIKSTRRLTVEEIKKMNQLNQINKLKILTGFNNMDSDYETIYMNRDMVARNILESDKKDNIEIMDENIFCMYSADMNEFYYVYNIKIDINHTFFQKNKHLEFINNIDGIPYFSLVVLTYIDLHGNLSVDFASFSDQCDSESGYKNVANIVSRYDDGEKHILSGIEIIDVRKSDSEQHVEYLINKGDIFSEHIHTRYLFPE